MFERPEHPARPPVSTGIRERCPRCGEGHQSRGFPAIAPECDVCSQNFSFADPAGGPAFFAICNACIPSVILAQWIEAKFEAPYWVHLVSTLPVLLATCIPPLRPLKGGLVATQYHSHAEEGQLDQGEPLPSNRPEHTGGVAS